MLKTSDKQHNVRCPRKRTHYVERNKYKTNYGFLIKICEAKRKLE